MRPPRRPATLTALAATAAMLFAGLPAAAQPAAPTLPALQKAASADPAVTTTTTAERKAVAAAARYIEDGLAAGEHDDFTVTEVQTGLSGTTYVAYDRLYHGLPVVGGDVVVTTDRRGRVSSDPLSHAEPIDVRVEPTVDRQDAARAAREVLPEVETVSEPKLVVFSPEGEDALAYRVVVEGRAADGGPSIMHVIVDAHTGGVRASWDQVMRGHGNGYYYDDVTIDTTPQDGGHTLRDPVRSGLTCGIEGRAPVHSPDDSFGSGSGTDLETACVDGYWAAQQQWDMLRDWLGRDGLDGEGGSFPMYVGLDRVNAYWNGHTTNFGRTKDGERQLTSMDIVGHEYGHAIFQYTPGGFDGYAQTYQLNEANGDIFGALTEAYADSTDDPADYVYAEEPDAFGRGPERIMYQPSLGPRDEPDCYTDNMDEIEVHDGAGPANHFFYLMAEGSNPGGGMPDSPICEGGPASVTGLGIKAAGQIWMETLLGKTSFWEYADARTASLHAVKRLFPGDCDAYDTVKGAWDAVAVPPQSEDPPRPGNCDGTPSDEFSLSLSPASGTVTAGETATARVVTAVTTGSPQQIRLTASGLPAGVSADFEPSTVTAGESATLNLTTSADTPAGSYQVAVTAAGETSTHTARFSLAVTASDGPGDPGDPPTDCTGYEHTTQLSLGSYGLELVPGSSGFAAGDGTHAACLAAATDGAEVDLYLQMRTGSSWTFVATETSPGADTTLTYEGAAGTYRYLVVPSGEPTEVTFGYDTP